MSPAPARHLPPARAPAADLAIVLQGHPVLLPGPAPPPLAGFPPPRPVGCPCGAGGMRTRSLLGIAAAAAVLAGGGERAINQQFAKRGLKTTTTCPQHVPIRVGATTTCRSTDAKGASLPITVTITDSIGAYRLRAG